MSYEIESGKLVLEVPASAPERAFFPGTPNTDIGLFFACWASSNVSPQCFSGTLLDVAYRAPGESYRLPAAIFDCAYSADYGMIKPHRKFQSGLSYLKAWRKKAAEPSSLFGMAVTAQASIWAGKGKAPECVTGGMRELFSAVDAVASGDFSHHSAYIVTPAQWGLLVSEWLHARAGKLSLCVSIDERYFREARAKDTHFIHS